jgi:hypothetical protein
MHIANEIEDFDTDHYTSLFLEVASSLNITKTKPRLRVTSAVFFEYYWAMADGFNVEP